MREFEAWLPMPSHMLTKNYSNAHATAAGQKSIRRVAASHRADATNLMKSMLDDSPRPYFPEKTYVEISIRIERGRRGQKWDNSAVIEAMKSYIDGFEGNEATGPLLFTNDQYLVWGTIEWDTKPTRPIPGDGRIYLTFREIDKDAVTIAVPQGTILSARFALESAHAELNIYRTHVHLPRAERITRVMDDIDKALRLIEEGKPYAGA